MSSHLQAVDMKEFIPFVAKTSPAENGLGRLSRVGMRMDHGPEVSRGGGMVDAEALNEEPLLLPPSISTEDGDGVQAAGLKTVFFESPGTKHEWHTWRRSLNDFVPRWLQTAQAAPAQL
jgi:hypothetical protein